MRQFLKIVLFILLLPVIYLVVINLLPDEELSAGAKEWLKPEPITVPKEQNSYYLLWGLDAPVGVDMWEYGEARVARIIAVESSGGSADADYMPSGYDENDLIKAKGIMDSCSPVQKLCLDIYQNNVMRLLDEGNNRLLLERYRELIAQSYYQRVSPHGLYTPIPPLAVLRASHRLYLITLMTRYQQSEVTYVLQQLSQLLSFNRTMLRKSDILIDRMMALALLADTLHAYSQLLELEQPHAELITVIGEINELTKDERSFDRVMRGELQFMQQTFDSALARSVNDGIAGRVVSLIFPLNKNRMINKAHEEYRDVVALESLPPTSVVQESERLMRESMPDGWDYIGDPLTSIILAIRAPDISYYLLRHYDLNAIMRLIKLKALIKKEGVSKENIDAFIATSPYASAYPEEMAPVRWEAGEEALIFDSALGDRANKRNRIFFRAD